ncbi:MULTISPECIES: 6,7-dimethyl-8-ribityllumazine synthase [unclassified Solwaraspora]|uniref:6,7-dimethyl-8-ribityllumazine synthase n=1 Tax=unclassified Solwaraspora TaxID=2627926 RepID=UPI00259B65AF|nr:6,7-dimethyl-8-ribityllumazine synthase [Solwaraspora sp. WMMA2056]WJK39223.1 6,7-dimethyl-8-ribityllumazine synthase [Solwaraspora sp. WMMA2056]
MAGFGEPGVIRVDAAGLRVGVVAARWHADLVDVMLGRAVAAAEACGVTEVQVARVAGSVELPVLAQALARRCDAVVALGVVVRGATAHFDYVCRSVTDGLTRVSLDEATPVGHGVLTVETIAQARDRAGLPGSAEDKGWASMVAVLDAALALRAVHAVPAG